MNHIYSPNVTKIQKGRWFNTIGQMVIGYYSLLLWQLIFNQNTRRMKKLIIQTICLLFVCLGPAHVLQEYLLSSPDG